MPDKILEITNKTMVPLSFIVLGWFAVSWVLDLKKTSEINAMTVKSQKSTQEKLSQKMDSITERLAKIEASLIFIKENIERSKK